MVEEPLYRPLRVDAERNRQAIVCAAESVFADEGTAVSLEHIAEVAGVGVGTIYRRFPSIDSLVQVVLEVKMSRYADRSEDAAEQALTQPWEAFRDYVLYILEQQASDLAFSDVILDPRSATELFRHEIARAFGATLLLVERAKDAGAIRADFDHSDLFVLLHANAGVIRGVGHDGEQARKRFAAYLLKAFHDGGPEVLPAPPKE